MADDPRPTDKPSQAGSGIGRATGMSGAEGRGEPAPRGESKEELEGIIARVRNAIKDDDLSGAASSVRGRARGAADSVGQSMAYARSSPDEDSTFDEMLRALTFLSPVEKLNAVRRMVADLYVKLSAGDRFRTTDVSTLISYGGCIVAFVMWWLLLPPLRMADISVISSAFAADGVGVGGVDPKVIINIAIFAGLLLTFVASVWVSFFGKSDKAIDAGSTTAKTLLGFFIGAGTKYLGI
jgi:hypothetical protein